MPELPFIHKNAIVEPGAKIGKGSRIWAFVHILPGARIGVDCNINDGVFIENDVIVGDRVTVKCGVQLWDGTRLEDDVFVGPNTTFTNDPFPRSKHHLQEYPKTIVRKGASIGANSTILPGIEVGRNAMVGAGTVVTRNVPQNAIVFGNPARVKGYVNSESQQATYPRNGLLQSESLKTSVPEVNIVRLPGVSDHRGELTFGEYDRHLLFLPKRYFIVYGVPPKEVRGEHAHRNTHQFLVCIKGSVNVIIENGRQRDEVVLNDPHLGLHIPPLIWAVQYLYSQDAILLVLASEKYDDNDYIRNYDEFLDIVHSGGNN